MASSGKATRVEWRGSQYPNAAHEIPLDDIGEFGSDRVVLLVSAGSNQKLLARHLRKSWELVEPAGAALPPGLFDVAIADITGLRQWREQLLDAKRREEPTFLPVIVVVSGNELKHKFKSFWDIVDEFVVSPIEPREFTERVSMLLRTRRLALAQQSRLAYMVSHDRATGLPNRTLFMDRLTDAVRDASILNKQLHVTAVHIPLSRIMTSLGHHSLERLAAICSSRQVALLRDEVSVARLTTEEWGLIHSAGADLSAVLEICGRIQHLADEPVDVDGERVRLAPRIGIAMYPDDGADAGRVLDSAISALSDAKAKQRADPVFYSSNVQHEALRFIRTESRLHEALEKQQFELWFQPQINLKTGEPVGAEALVRWRLPGGELVSPGEFLPVAEATGQIHHLDRWVLDRACATMCEWYRDKRGIQRVSVNVTVEDIEAPDFVEFIENALQRYELPPPSLELELTETTLFKTSSKNLDKLSRLRSYGLSVAVDDFGKGYSSLGYLHKLPITTLKIDKDFVDNVATSATDAAIAETIVWLAAKFNLETVAEGVETVEQVRFLQSIGVSTAQGFLYARPMPEAQLIKWVNDNRDAASLG